MQITRKNVLLADKVNAKLFQVDGELLWNNFKMEVFSQLQIVCSLLNTDINTLSDEEFLEYFNMLYDINCSKNDELDILSLKYAQKFDRVVEISTSMIINNDIGQKNRLEWEQLYQTKLLIAVAKGVDIDLNKTYSKDELKLLLDNFDIVILDEILEKIDYCDFVRETIEHFPIENAYTHLAKFIKANINKECIMQDIVSYYNELIEHIHDVIVICKKMNREELVAEIKESIAEFLTCSNLKRP